MSNSLHSEDPRPSLAVPMLFAALEPALKERLIASSPPRAFADSQIIPQRGTLPDGFWLIEEGSVPVGRYLAEGEFRAVAVLGPGDSYGELAVFAGTKRIVDAVSRGASRVRLVDGALFLAALDEDPVSSRAMLGALSAQLQDSLDQLAGLRRGSTPARLAGLLANLVGEGGVTRITQQELAELLGVTRATANAALRTLEDAGIIERGYGAIRVSDPEGLVSRALS